MTTDTVKTQIEAVEALLISLKNQLATSEAEAHRFDWQLLNDRLGILTDNEQRYGWWQTAYIGFATKKDAEGMIKRFKFAATWCTENGKPAPYTAIELRQASRLLACKWELKITDMALALLDKVSHELTDPRDIAA
jgi:hypothetical protein